MNLLDIKIGNLKNGILLELKDIEVLGNNKVYDTTLNYNIKNINFACENNLCSCHSKILLKFLNDLYNMHKNLSGETNLTFYDNPSFLNIKYQNNGSFLFSGKIYFTSYEKCLIENTHSFSFILNQSYLNNSIKNIKLDLKKLTNIS